MNPIKVWVVRNQEGEAMRVFLFPENAYDYRNLECSDDCYIDAAYLAPIEPSEDMIKEALKLSDGYYGPYESDIEAIYTAMMESRDE